MAVGALREWINTPPNPATETAKVAKALLALEEVLHSSTSPASITDLHAAFWEMYPKFDHGNRSLVRQYDAHEVLLALIDALSMTHVCPPPMNATMCSQAVYAPCNDTCAGHSDALTFLTRELVINLPGHETIELAPALSSLFTISRVD